MMARSFRSLLLCSVLLIAASAGPSSAATGDDQAIAQLQVLDRAFTTITKRVTPTVVTISTKQTVDRSDEMPRDFFHPFFRGNPRFRMPKGEEEREGLGSGIVVSPDGYILTNHHVAAKADQITVTLSDNREFEAKLVGSDSLTDIAVIKIPAKGLPTATLGNSDHLQIGEWVLAIGAPMGLSSTVTSGIVSAIGRNIHILQDSYAVEDFIQTDAAINPGNSGGALVDLEGKVIGVNTAIATRTGSFVGYGFAIPIDLAKKVMDDIIKYGHVRRGFLGVSLEAVTAREADAFGLDRPRGVLIGQVLADSPAESAGLKAGDIIFKIDGQDVNRPNQIQSLIARKHPDDVVTIELRRKDKLLNLKAKLGENAPQAPKVVAEKPRPGKTEHLGLSLQNITPEIAENLGLPKDTEGVVVANVEVGPARDAGFRPGDVIFHVRQGNIDQDIRSIKDFETALTRLEKGRNAAFSIRRGAASTFLAIQIPK